MRCRICWTIWRRRGFKKLQDTFSEKGAPEKARSVKKIHDLEKEYAREKRGLLSHLRLAEAEAQTEAKNLQKTLVGLSSLSEQHRARRETRTRLQGGAFMDTYHTRLDLLTVLMCTEVLKIADEQTLNEEFLVGRSLRGALVRHQEIQKEKASQPTASHDVNLSRILGRAGFIEWNDSCRGRKAPTIVTEYSRAFESAHLLGARPSAYAMWLMDLLQVDSPNQRLNHGWYPIHFACDSGFLSCQPDIIEGLLRVTDVAVLNSRTEGSQPPLYTPLMMICDGSNRAPSTNSMLVERLVLARADIEAEDSHRNTPFLKAASTGMTDVCRNLVRLRCDPNAVNERGANAAKLAQGLGNKGGDTLRFLKRELQQEPNEAPAGGKQRKGVGKQRAVRYASTIDWSTASTLGGGQGGRKGWNKGGRKG